MEQAELQNRLRLVLFAVFIVLGLLAILGWAYTGQREFFETPALFFGATSIVLSFGFF
jgi:hypothetical protein